jgi:hypothetical protein
MVESELHVSVIILIGVNKFSVEKGDREEKKGKREKGKKRKKIEKQKKTNKKLTRNLLIHK